MAQKKSFLFLQGSYSRFTRELAESLYSRGHHYTKVNFYGGDKLFWGINKAIDYQQGLDELPDFYEQLFNREHITDVILFNDNRPVHSLVLPIAKKFSANVYVMEEGYFRPHWINLEWGGMNGNSYLSKDPQWYFEQNAQLETNADFKPVGGAFKHRVYADLANTTALYLLHFVYPHYQTHRPYPVLREYMYWLKRLSTLKFKHYQTEQIVRQLIASSKPYFVFPLQLDTDVQVRHHSIYGGMVKTIEAVIQSFAANANNDSFLIIKNHPLDNGMINYDREIKQLSKHYAVEKRVLFIEGGNLDLLTQQSSGMVLLNSTAGITALNFSKPLIALGKAIYDIPGITFQGDLDDFWHSDFQYDQKLLTAFKNVVSHIALINGNFYTSEGRALAIQNSLPRLEAMQNPYKGLPPQPLCNSKLPQKTKII